MEYHYIIVGAGTAGCALSHRLSENPDVNILLLEAGPADNSLKLRIPAAFIYNYTSPTYNWMYETEPDPFMDNKKVFCPRGKVLGGSSSINGMAFVRGHADDFNDWAKQGLPTWSYAHCLPYFKKMETYSGGADDYRGGNGPQHVYRPKHQNPLYKIFLEACDQAGHLISYDTNGFQQEGFSPMDQSIYNGARWSTATGYLHSIKQRKNLTIQTDCHTTRILFKGSRAIGVEYEKSGKLHLVHTTEEVILSAGATNSPQLLLLSGVGPAEQLNKLGIPVIADLPGVGENLQEHYDISVQHACTKPWSVNNEMAPLKVLKNGLRWVTFKDGPATTNQSEIAGYVRSRSSHRPDLQVCFMPVAFDYEKMKPITRHGFRLFTMPLRPTSVGHIKLKSSNPKIAPSILCNYMSTEVDRQDFRDLIEISRNIIAQKAFDAVRGKELEPGEKVTSNLEIDASVRRYGKPTHHLCGTCKMGIDKMAVVDEQLKVYGVEGLRVVDASIMPAITSGNINAPVIMIGEKATDYFPGRRPLVPSDAPVYCPA